MAFPQFPQIGANAWRAPMEQAHRDLTQYFNDFTLTFGNVPDERGLTDSLLFKLQNYGKVKVDFIRPSQQEEAASGYDYAWSWQTIDRDSTVPQALKKLVFLQAKSYKPTGTPGKGSANFTYKQGGQMNALATTINQAKATYPNVVVIGGYLMYGPKQIQYIPIEDVLKAYNKFSTDGPMSDFFFTSEMYPVQVLFDSKK